MQLFYDPDIKPGAHLLREQEAIHAGRVLRKRVGDTLDIVDGRGGWYKGLIDTIDKRSCRVVATLVRQEAARGPHRLQLLVAPTKNIDRFEWVLEKTTEIGVDLIQPIFTEHSERTRLRLDRLCRVVESAMKQSLRAWMPDLRSPLPFAEALQPAPFPGEKFLAYLGDRSVPLLKNAYVTGTNATIAIGPEGGFSPDEAASARRLGYVNVSLGPHRLRTETAAIVAVQTIESANW